jgi:cyclophilin family peptidyl-prolyl cis-trans isomerase
MKTFLALMLLTNMAFAANPVVIIDSNMGQIEVELNQEKAPVSVKNFLSYVDEKFYDGTIFHRVINNFMIQGGGFQEGMKEKKTHAPIKNEAANGLKNEIGTIAMARTSDPDSATAQFYINVNDNSSLDYQNPSPMGIGYAVFGKVTSGMHVLNRIKLVKTGNIGPYSDVPMDAVIIKSIRRKDAPAIATPAPAPAVLKKEIKKIKNSKIKS